MSWWWFCFPSPFISSLSGFSNLLAIFFYSTLSEESRRTMSVIIFRYLFLIPEVFFFSSLPIHLAKLSILLFWDVATNSEVCVMHDPEIVMWVEVCLFPSKSQLWHIHIPWKVSKLLMPMIKELLGPRHTLSLGAYCSSERERTMVLDCHFLLQCDIPHEEMEIIVSILWIWVGSRAALISRLVEEFLSQC